MVTPVDSTARAWQNRTTHLTRDEFRVLLTALDMLEQSFGFHDAMGRLQHGNRAYLAEVNHGADGEVLRDQASQFARVMCASAFVARLRDVQRMGDHAVQTERGRYSLQGTFLGPNLFGGTPTVLITFTPPSPDPFRLEHLRTRFQLTRAQAKVARLLAEGLRNAEIAERLFLSEHTVRHHVEGVRIKVGGHTRAAVAARLRQHA